MQLTNNPCHGILALHACWSALLEARILCMVENFAISKNELVLCCFSIIDTWMNPDLCSTVRKYNCTCIIVDLALQAGLCVKGQQVIESQPDLPSSGFPAMKQ